MKPIWRALLWKEWRENSIEAATMFLAVAVFCAWMIYQAGTSNNPWELIWSQGLLLTFIFVAPMGAFLLGASQTWRELKHEQWAFLLHRPASRTVIFGGKVVPGLALYFLCCGLPLLGAVLWVAQPGHIPGPFDWRLLLPNIADIYNGVVYYFAGLLLAVRTPRRQGRRALGFPAALLSSAIITFVPEFWQALVISTLFAFMVGLAAWGGFIEDEVPERQPKAAQWGLAFTCYTGSMVCIALPLLFVTAFMYPSQNIASTDYAIDTRGRIVRVTQQNAAYTSVTNVQGHTETAPGQSKSWTYQDFLYSGTVDFRGIADVSANSYRAWRRYITALAEPGASVPTLWYYVQATGLLEGYARRDNRRIGYIGPQGFATDSATLQDRFHGDLNLTDYWGTQTGLLQFPGGVYWADITGQRVKPLYVGDDKIYLASRLYMNGYHGIPTQALGTMIISGTDTQKQIRIFSPEGKQLFVAPAEHGAPYNFWQIITSPDDRVFVKYQAWQQYSNTWREDLPIYITEYSSKGEVLHHHRLPLLAQIQYPGPSSAILAPLVPAGAFMASVANDARRGDGQALFTINGVPNTKEGSLVFGLGCVLSNLAYAALGWLIIKRRALPRREQWAWTIGVFLLGLYALVTLLALRPQWAREVCPTCGKKRVVNHEQCEHCAATFAPPALDGTEIFA